MFLIAPPIWLKTYHVHLKYGTTEKKLWTNNDKKLIIIILCALLFYFIYLTLWFTLASPKVIKTYVEINNQYVHSCTPLGIYDMLLFIPEILIMLWSLQLAVMHRKIPRKFNEAKYIAFALYTVFVIGMILLPVSLLAGNNYPLVLDILMNFGVLVVSWAIYITLFAVKIVKVIRKKKLEEGDPKLSISKSGNSTYLSSSSQMASPVSKYPNNVSAAATFSDNPPVTDSEYHPGNSPIKEEENCLTHPIKEKENMTTHPSVEKKEEQ